MKKIILTAFIILNSSLCFADSTSFFCSFTPDTERTPYVSYYNDGFRYSPGNLKDGPFELEGTLSKRFDDKVGDQVIFTDRSRNDGKERIGSFPEYAGFSAFCPTNVCRLMIDKPISNGRLSAIATAMIQKKTSNGNFTNYKAITCHYSFD